MHRFLQLIIALAAFGGGLWFVYGGYARSLSLAAKAETAGVYLRTGIDGKTRVLTHHQYYAVGAGLLLGSFWWFWKGHTPAPRRRR
jgi:hypothetical protein